MIQKTNKNPNVEEPAHVWSVFKARLNEALCLSMANIVFSTFLLVNGHFSAFRPNYFILLSLPPISIFVAMRSTLASIAVPVCLPSKFTFRLSKNQNWGNPLDQVHSRGYLLQKCDFISELLNILSSISDIYVISLEV